MPNHPHDIKRRSGAPGGRPGSILRPMGPSFILRDEFITPLNPTITSPHPCEPGPGSLNLTDDSTPKITIAGGLIKVVGTPTVTAPRWFVNAGYARVPGLAFKHNTMSDPTVGVTTSPGVGWWTSPVSIGAGNAACVGIRYTGSAQQFAIGDQDATMPQGLDTDGSPSVFYTMVHVLRSLGHFDIIGNKLAAICYTGNGATMYPGITQHIVGRNTPQTDYFHIAQLGYPWNSDYGIATQRLAGARAVNDQFTHEAAALWIDFIVTTLPSAGTIRVYLRRQDDSNCWVISINSAGVVSLLERVAGVDTARGGTVTVVNGDRVQLGMDGVNARLLKWHSAANIAATMYTSVATFTTQTGGIVNSFGTGGAISDIVTYPRNLNGALIARLNEI